MKRFFSIIAIFTIILAFIPGKDSFVMAAVEAPDKPIEVSCPPSYVGEKKCFYVTNPKTKENAKTIFNSVSVPQKEVVRITDSGKKISNEAFLWSMGTISTFLSSTTDYVQDTTKGFWSNVTDVSNSAKKIANSVTDQTAEAVQTAYDAAKLGANGIVDLPKSIWDDLFNNTKNELDDYSEYEDYLTDNTTDTYEGTFAESVVNIHKQSTGVYPDIVLYDSEKLQYYLSHITSVTDDTFGSHLYVYAVNGSLVRTIVNVSLGSTSVNALMFLRNVINNKYSHLTPVLPNKVGDETNVETFGTPSNMGIAAPIIPIHDSTLPKIVEIDDKKYYEVDNPISPAHPNLSPAPVVPPAKTGVKVPGHVLVDEDGNVIDQTTGSITGGSPITTPITTPLVPGDPGYKTPSPPIATPNGDKCIKCLPELVPNFFGLFAVFFAFLAACLAYLFKLLVFVIKIPMIPERRFPGTVGETFDYFKNLSIGSLEIYGTMITLVTFLLGFVIYKLIRRMF